MMCCLYRLNKYLENKADSLFGWGIVQSSFKQGSCMNCLLVLNYLNFELLHIKDKRLSLRNFHI
jgi:hypothetical protein